MHHSVEEVKELYYELRKDNPDIGEDIICAYIEKMTDEAYKTFSHYMHITSPAMYKRAVSTFTWKDRRGSGDKWSVDKIVELSGIDFNTKKYTIYDYAYEVNKLYSDHPGSVEAETYLAFAKDNLEDEDYTGDPSTRAYKDAKKRIRYMSQ